MTMLEKELRFKRDGFASCAACLGASTSCGDGTACKPAKQRLRPYCGVRFTSDGFDCALPVSIDSHSFCSFGCLYCFAPNLTQKRVQFSKPIGQASLREIEGIISGKSKSKKAQMYRSALRYDAKKNGYPCALQLGAIADPLDNIERHQGWFLEFAKLVKKYNQPVRISTKGNLFLEDEYLKAVADKPELFRVLFSINSCDEGMLKLIDKRAPSCAERIESMKRLEGAGVKTGLRMRPILPGISDSTPDHPEAWKELIQMAAGAGSRIISYEATFVPGQMTQDLKRRWREIEKVSGVPIVSLYRKFGKVEACTRPHFKWTEAIMHAIRDEAHRQKMVIGISDPVWKQLGDVGCCCGFSPDDPVFGNWQVESVTNRLIECRDGKRKEIGSADIIPPWAKHCHLQDIVNTGVGPTAAYGARHTTWADKLREVWNCVQMERSPLNYLQGALIPFRKKGKEVFYKYVGLKRTGEKNPPFWKVTGNTKRGG